jgi:hypothetical protein
MKLIFRFLNISMEGYVSTYCISFRIADKAVNGKSYSERRKLLVDNAQAAGNGTWDETTSFLLVSSSLDTNSFSTRVCKGLSSADDMVFIFDPSDSSACYFGVVKDVAGLKKFFPGATKIP